MFERIGNGEAIIGCQSLFYVVRAWATTGGDFAPPGALTQPGVAVLLVRAWSTTGGDFVPRGALIQPGVAVLLEWLCYLAVPKWYHTVEMPPQGSGAKCGMSTTPIRDTSQKSF